MHSIIEHQEWLILKVYIDYYLLQVGPTNQKCISKTYFIIIIMKRTSKTNITTKLKLCLNYLNIKFRQKHCKQQQQQQSNIINKIN